MNPEEIASRLETLWGGQTLASLRDEATREFNGTCFSALRRRDGPRDVLIVCVTGAHELGKLEGLDPAQAYPFGDWSKVSLFEAWLRTRLAGGFCYDAERKSGQALSAVVLIAAVPRSITRLEALLNLGP
jgi:hypothetical protein